MLISKTRFFNLIRCPRYAALEDIYLNKNKAVVSFSTVEDLEKYEYKEKIKNLVDSMYDEETGEDLITSFDPKMEVFADDFKEIEILAAKKAERQFKGTAKYSEYTNLQKHFEYQDEDYGFHCFLDIYLEKEDEIIIIEVKSVTSNSFFNDFKKTINRTPYYLFTKTPDNNLIIEEKNKEALFGIYQKFFDIYATTASKHAYDLAFQRYVIEHAKDKPNKKIKYYLGILNHEYKFDGKYIDSKPYYDPNKIISFVDLTEITYQLQPKIEEYKKLLFKYLNEFKADKCNLGKYCMRKKTRECQFLDVCMKDLNIPEKNSIFTYTSNHNGFKDPETKEKYHPFDLISIGKTKALDLTEDWLERINNIYQRRVIESHQEYIDKEKINTWINNLKYPIYHLDFETLASPLPKFKGETPYTQSPFQFSIHIEKSPGDCDKEKDNYYHLNKDNYNDYREEIIKKLIDIIKDDNGTVLAYNKGFEKSVLRKLGENFPEYKKDLENRYERLDDLMYPVKGNNKFYNSFGYSEEEVKSFCYYHEDMQGSFSIKKVLPVLSTLSYKNLAVKNGNEAVIAYATMQKDDPNDLRKKREDLLKYCGQDTWAMVVILDKLREKIK